MGLLSGNSIQNIFGKVFSSVYEDGSLVRIQKVRQPNGTLLDVPLAPVPVKVQLDRVTERMSRADGYASTDKKVIILRAGLLLDWIDSDNRLMAQGKLWLLNEVETDPARSHFEARASLSGSAP